MKKSWKRIGCVAACTVLVAGIGMVSQASGKSDQVSGAPVAGMAISLSDYYTAVENGVASKAVADSITSMLKNDSLSVDETESSSEEAETKAAAKKASAETEESTEEPDYMKDEKASVLTQYYNLGVAMPTNGYLNIRAEASTDSEVIGRMSKYAGMEVVSDNGNGWYQIVSGPVTGYVAKEYILTGEEAKEVAVEKAYFAAKIRKDSLNFRKEMSTDSEVLTQLSSKEKYEANAVYGDWVELNINGSIGYVSLDYVTVDYFLQDAVAFTEITIEDTADAGNTAEAGQTAAAAQGGQTASAGQSQTAAATQAPTQAATQAPPASTNGSLRQQVVNFALQWQDPNGYQWGGTVLGQGVDCSGFTQAVMAHFGIGINRTAASQASNGTRIDPSQAQPGDLLFYSNIGGPINHVAIYIGNGQIIHSASERSGILISDWHYNTPVACVNVIG